MPEFAVSGEKIRISKLLLDSGLCASGGEAKRLIQGGGVTLGGEKVASPETEVEIADGQVLRAGKRKFLRLRKM